MSPRILFTLHCLSVWIATQSNTLQMFSVSFTKLSQPMPHHMCRLIKQAIFLGADSRPMTINISASSFRISSGFIKYLNPSVLWAQSKQRANQRTTTDIDQFTNTLAFVARTEKYLQCYVSVRKVGALPTQCPCRCTQLLVNVSHQCLVLGLARIVVRRIITVRIERLVMWLARGIRPPLDVLESQQQIVAR